MSGGQPLKQCPRASTVAWCSVESQPTLMALGASAASAGASMMGSDTASECTLDLVSFDLSRPGHDMDILASIRTEGGRKFNSISWGSLGCDGPMPYGMIAGALQEGIVSFWDPAKIVNSKGLDPGLIHSRSVHTGSVNCVEFHPLKPGCVVTCGSDGEVNILNMDMGKLTQPDVFKPSDGSKTHAGSEVLSCAWNRKVPNILGSCSNKGTTVVWDLKQKKEVISFQDPANRLRASDVAWNPEKPTQLVVAYDDDRNPSMQMWDLRNVKYPFKETSGHSKGILGLSWNAEDPNLMLSCGKDNRMICWFNSPTGLEAFCEIPSHQPSFEVKWAPHKPSLISAASLSGTVSVHSVQTQQTSGAKYCPKWYRRPCGANFGFGGKVLAFGEKKAAAAVSAPGQNLMASWCHSLVVPNEPEIVATADLFEQWRAERKFQEFCHDKTRKSGGTTSHEGLMWNLMGLQFEAQGRANVPALLGFDQERIEKEAERYLGRKPGSTLLGEKKEEDTHSKTVAKTSSLGPELNEGDADDFFKNLAETTEQTRAADEAMAQMVAQAVCRTDSGGLEGAAGTDWSTGPECLIKQSLLVGNLTAAVECCFKSGRMAEALLLASGGGTTLWTRARDEYLRLQGDAFLSTVGHIMTNDFDQLVENSNLKGWMETLAIIATYSGEAFQMLCERLGERLEKENFDIRSAVICYICANNFPKTVSIWANTHVASIGSKKLALQDLVEKMAVLQEATKFNQADALFNAKLTQYAEILANSGRLTAAMRYLCLLQNDTTSAILRDRIYHSAPMQMGQVVGRQPPMPFQVMDVRILHREAPQAPAAYGAPQHGGMPGQHGGMPGHHGQHGAMPGHPHAPMPGHQQPPMPGMPRPPMPGQQRPPMPGQGMPGQGMPGQGMPGQGMPMPGVPGGGPCGIHGQQGMMPPAPAPSPAPMPPGSQLPPRPTHSSPTGGMGPVSSFPQHGGAQGYGGQGGYGQCGGAPAGPPAPAPPVPGSSLPPRPTVSMGQQQPGQQMQGMGMNPNPAPSNPYGGSPYGGASPGVGPGVGHGVGSPYGQPGGQANAGGPPMPPQQSTAPTASAAPVVEDMPQCWPLPTPTQQKLYLTKTTADSNKAIHEMHASKTIGEPMQQADLARIKGVFGMLLDMSSSDGNMKKREETSKRLEELYSKLAEGQIKTQASQKVLALVNAIEMQDYGAANKMQMELCTLDWDQNRNWLMGIKRLIPRG